MGTQKPGPAGSSDVKGLSAAAAVLLVGVVELEALVEALAHEVELGAVEVGEALGVDQDSHAVALEGLVLGLHLVGEFELVREPRAACGAHAKAYAAPLAALLDVAPHVVGGAIGKGDRHVSPPPSCRRRIRRRGRRTSSGSRRRLP